VIKLKPVKVGLVGCGFISEIYLKNSKLFNSFDVVACSDLILERSEGRAKEFDISKVCSTSEIMEDPKVEMVLNLTTPDGHYDVAKQAVTSKKSVYNEKPLAIELDNGWDLVESAERNGVLIGGAPDTFLGGGIQTCRKLIDDGWIGEPIGATAFMTCPGHESWHPDPEFYYKKGGGPMFDMGPYYLTALVNLLGPIKQVKASTKISFSERMITSKPKYGTKIKVDVPTHVVGIMDFQNGTTGNIITSFDVWGAQLPRIEIYGKLGSLSVPDPNTFGGPVHLYLPEYQEWREIPLSHGYTFNSRGIGVADMANALRSGRTHRANGDLTYHILEVMHAFHTASDKEKTVKIKSKVKKPSPLPLGLIKGYINP
jgi:predicted dehydrogenase